jgi:hypothetical protein
VTEEHIYLARTGKSSQVPSFRLLTFKEPVYAWAVLSLKDIARFVVSVINSLRRPGRDNDPFLTIWLVLLLAVVCYVIYDFSSVILPQLLDFLGWYLWLLVTALGGTIIHVLVRAKKSMSPPLRRATPGTTSCKEPTEPGKRCQSVLSGLNQSDFSSSCQAFLMAFTRLTSMTRPEL